ncbi:papilin isoform X3 [Danaus plexippus]|uniref:papilin isoform X3 n=1 Tax=Danaus plexippus TaxID=13037 RepID=UPI002AB0F1C7|nr:papilin isoform X3 [Danaus plexippus]
MMGMSSLRSLLLAAFLLSNVSWSTSRHHFRHNIHGHRSRHRRQDAGLFHPASYVIPGGEGTGVWGEWGKVSPCSRTCGGGVANQKRICLEVGLDNQPLCTGGDTKYFSCQTQDCPESAGDFRAEQCAEYDNQAFRGSGIKYNWVPYTKAPNPCELNCMPRGERFYYRQKAQVIDGTRCNDESFDVCVDGVCQPVGCDMMLGSNAREDKCRQCRGNGTNCHTVSGLLDTDDLRKGYNDMLLIPQGATNIFIEEVRESNNYLALRAKQDNVYYLNGDYHIDFPRSLVIAGSLWHYERSQQGYAAPDKLRCLGPTDEPLYLSLLLQDYNVGISYEYSVPTALAPPSNQQYNWVHESFSECSATCGGGYQTRQVTCRSREELNIVDESLCDEGLRPATNQTCNIEACPPRWVEGPWSPCSKPCGDGGTRSRQIYCEKIITNRFPSIVADKECFDLLGPKPELYQTCNENATCPTWFTGPWKPCDKLCGEGKQTRQVVCHQRIDGFVRIFEDSECEDEKPMAEKKCILHPCDGVDWVLSDWSGCDTCLSSVRTRVALCATKDRKVVDSELCSYHPNPLLVEECDRTKLPPCQVQWYATQWSNCSVECGKGVQTRRVFCGLFDGASVMKVDDERCDQEYKYNSTKECEVPQEKCPAKWFAGPWSECTKKCGGGEQYRRVMCLGGGKEILMCDKEAVPDSTQSCNIGPCDKDDLLPIDSKSTPIMDDYDDEECVVEDYEYPEEGAEAYVSEASGSPTLFPEFIFGETTGTYETTDITGFTETTETDLLEGSASGPTETTDISVVTEVSTENSDSTVTDETEASTTEVSDVTSSGSSDSSETDSTDSVSTEETESTSEYSQSSTTESSFSSTDNGMSTTEDELKTNESGSSTTESGISTTESSTEKESSTQTTDFVSTIGSSESSESSTTESDSSSTIESSSLSTVINEFETSTILSSTTEDELSTLESEPSTTENYSSSSESGSSVTESESSTTEGTESSTISSSESESTEGSTLEYDESSTPITDLSSTTETDESSTTDNVLTSTTELLESSSTERSESTSTENVEVSTTESVQVSTTESDKISTTDSIESSSTESVESSTTDNIELSSTESSQSSTTETDISSTSENILSSVTDISESSTTESEVSSSTATDETSTMTTFESSTTDTSLYSTSEEFETTETSEFSSTEGISDSTTTVSSTESTESNPTESSDITGTSESSTATAGSTESSSITEETVTEESVAPKSTPWDWASTIEVFTKKPCRPRKRTAKCVKSKFGCCPDKRTPAAGPFDEGCPNPKTCKESKFGCCPDGVSPAPEPKGKGCPVTLCNETLYGCCKSDNITAAEGNNQEGCPPPPPVCKSSEFGCCEDNETIAKGPNKEGCSETVTEKVTPVVAVGCASSEFGCCYDNETDASGPNGEGCPCSISEFGCCPDGLTTAGGANMEGCVMSCNTSAYGCCPDGETPAHGPDSEGCCVQTSFGCCPDNYKPAEGPHLEGCGCQYAHYGCCPDNVTVARGPNMDGCGCAHSQYGCCPDRHTQAQGPEFEGCGCHTYQFGCCLDGVTIASGPEMQGCRCVDSKYGCCGDEKTHAKGPNNEGCDCSNSKYGCCPDGITEAQGEKFLNCTDAPINRQAACALANDGGPCRNYSVYWFYDMTYGGCSRFWYGGCEGNGNRFLSEEECKDVCVQPSPKDACNLPKVKGACQGYHVRWYYDSQREQCSQFVFGGCLGNANNFDSKELCQERCEPEKTEDTCNLPIERGPCAGNFARWGFNPEKRRCEQFVWGGCEGNANRFNSEAACLLQCDPPGTPKQACSQLQDVGNCTEKHAVWSFSQTENRCIPFYYSGCGGNDNRFESESSCAKSCPSVYEQEICTLPALTGECADYTQRWFFDTTKQRCRPFYYGGCGGNENNFYSEMECETRCSEQPVTTTVQPLTMPPTQTQPNVPTPERSEFCYLEIDSGPCTQPQTRYAFDASRGTCVQFQYGGCGGNRNHFPSLEYCQYYCGVSQDVCQLPFAEGPCDQSIMQWFYDAASDSCSQFTYGGCEGNGNRFNTLEECESRCRQSLPATTTTSSTTTITPVYVSSECQVSPALEECRESGEVWYLDQELRTCVSFVNEAEGSGCRHTGAFHSQEACERACGAFRGLDVCRYSLDPGPCREMVPKFYYNEATGRCESFTYGGCHGGPNRFSSLEECEQICRPNTDPCIQSPESGNCLAYFVMWYYDSSRDECGQFVYGGCNGNDNRFETQAECEGRCKKGIITTTAFTLASVPSTTSTSTSTTTTTTTTTQAPSPTPQFIVEAECSTPESLAVCGKNITVYYFDTRTQACLAGDFGGCRYANSYRTEEECQRRCGAFRGLDVCGSRLDPGPCLNTIPKFYWDPLSGRCLSFAYGGCHGGPNRFSTVEECEEICGATGPEARCLVPVSSGTPGCGVPSRRWYYSVSFGDCLAFVYSGCGGNENNFHTYEECAACKSDYLIPDKETGNEVLPDCDDFNAECAALECKYGVQRIRVGGGCERCSCIAPEVDCEPLAKECKNLKCTYGLQKTTDDDGCERCNCIDHPCANKECEIGERCVSTPYRDAISQEILYSSDCRIANKSGSCPSEAVSLTATESQCRRQCNDDADCPGVGKCCERGCSHLCLEPVSPTSPTARPVPIYVPELPQVPYANEATEPEVHATLGGKVTLRCLFHGNPPPKITWQRGQITIEGDVGRYRLMSDGSLEIVSLYRNDSGVYICVADNGLGIARQEINLQVEDGVDGPAGIAGLTDTVVVGELGQPLSVRCMAYGYPTPSIYWYHGRNGPMVPFSSPQYEARDNILQIRKLSIDTLGEYICQAYNGIGKPVDWSLIVQAYRSDDSVDSPYLVSRQHEVLITPREPQTEATTTIAPEIEIPVYTVPVTTRIVSERTRLAAGSELNLLCEVDGYPVPEVYWTKDSVRISSDERIRATEARLTVMRTNTNDSGVYSCHAFNAYNSHYSSVEISVEGLYIPPTCKDNPYFANCHLIVRSKFCHHKYYSGFCCKSCVEAGQLDPRELELQADSPLYRK